MKYKEMKQIKGSKNCVAIVACIATGSTVDEFESICGKHPDGGYSDQDINKFLVHKGYFMGVGFSELKGKITDKTTHISLEINIKDFPAYVVVKSKTYKEKTHAIFWDGEKIFDPSPVIKNGMPLESYEIFSWFPIHVRK